jgi:hypothetical protein
VCHEKSQIRSSDYVSLIKRNLLREGPLITERDLAPIQRERELACECNRPPPRLTIEERYAHRADRRYRNRLKAEPR